MHGGKEKVSLYKLDTDQTLYSSSSNSKGAKVRHLLTCTLSCYHRGWQKWSQNHVPAHILIPMEDMHVWEGEAPSPV